MIQTKSIYEPASPNDGIRINVARFVPRSIRENTEFSWDLHLPCVAPSQELLEPFKNKAIKFPIFIKRYLNEMKGVGAQVGFKTIASLSICGTVTLLCYEKTDTFCHRRFIDDIVKNMIIEVQFDFERIWHYDVARSVLVLESEYSQKIKEAEEQLIKEEREKAEPINEG